MSEVAELSMSRV